MDISTAQNNAITWTHRLAAKHVRRGVLVSLISISLAGCSNLEAIRNISSNLTTASASWNEVATEVLESCRREQVFNTSAILSDCDLEERASKGLVAANGVLRSYFAALNAAATESNFTIDPGLNAVGSSVGNIPGINQSQVQSVTGLFTFLTDIATTALRERTIRELISEGAPSAQNIISAMDELVVDRLIGRLDTEQTQLTSTFAGWLQAEQITLPDAPSSMCAVGNAPKVDNATGGTAFLLIQEYCQRIKTIEARMKAVSDYQTSLEKASAAITELQSPGVKLESDELAERLQTIGSDLRENITSLQAAFD